MHWSRRFNFINLDVCQAIVEIVYDILPIIKQSQLVAYLEVLTVPLDRLLVDILIVCVDDPAWDHIVSQKLLLV